MLKTNIVGTAQLISPEKTMSTREIAELLGKQHTNIKISADRLAAKGVIAPQETPYIDPQNKQTYHEYHLTKRDSLILVAQNCPEFTARIVDRWQELESQQAKPAELTRMDILRMAMESEEARIKAESALAIAAPKAEVFDRVIERDTLLNATQVAQQVGMSAVKMNRILDDMGGVYNQSIKRGRAFCQSWVSAGHGEMKIGEQGYPQPLFTPKGALRVVEMLTSEGVI